MLASLLDKLHRPIEALAWRAVEVAYARSSGQTTDTEAMRMISQINQQRMEALRSGQDTARREFILCGVDLDSK